MTTTSKVQWQHIKSLYYMNIGQFFTCWNFIPPIKFHFARVDSTLVSFATIIWSHHATHTLSQMGNIWCCVRIPNNSYKGNNSKCGTNAFYFFLEVFRQQTTYLSLCASQWLVNRYAIFYLFLDSIFEILAVNILKFITSMPFSSL